MISYVTNFFNYLFYRNDGLDDNDDDLEDFLAQELLELDIQTQQEESLSTAPAIKEIPCNAVCITKTGLITYCGEDCVLIDGAIYFNTSDCSLELNLNDKVLYLAYKDANDKIVVVRILENQGLFWGDEEEVEEESHNIVEHVLIGHVKNRQDRFVYISDGDLKFSLDDVEGTFVPIKGDWLELKCCMQEVANKPSDMSTNRVLKVISFTALRTKVKSAYVTYWSGNTGICDGQIYFDTNCFSNCTDPLVGSKVLVEAIESNQGSCTWRALQLTVIDKAHPNKQQSELPNEEQISLILEKDMSIEMTHPLKFEHVHFVKDKVKTLLCIKNKSQKNYIINKWIMLGRKKDSQIQIQPFITKPLTLGPGEILNFTVTCLPKCLGHSRECLIFLCKGFQLKRFIDINVIIDDHVPNGIAEDYNYNMTVSKKVEAMKRIRNNEDLCIPGIRTIKSAPFVEVRIGHFPIPNKIWSIILGDSETNPNFHDPSKIMCKLETTYLCLTKDLTIHNYAIKWHTLLYLEEVEANLQMRRYDKGNVFLLHCSEYLGIEITGLAEKRPSLIIGDKVIVKEAWKDNSPQYQGYIHAVKGNLVLIKLHQQFHEYYSGGDVSIEFHFSRTVYRRSHYAVDLAMSHLGPDILFPSRVNVNKQLQVSMENLDKLQWFNKQLNEEQKNAVINIIKGECRPMPYVIFGPPGTGKTITVIETALQILTLIPESRILIATPSNSASNLITELLIQYKESYTGSIVRLIANYLVDSNTIPDIIKPYCSTVDISVERTSKSKHETKDNINLNIPKSVIARHRVTIGTCHGLGALKHLNLPPGHFTHIIVDEAGQATEPEIMLPMTFTDKEHGQIILAGDPMQLGPVVLSIYCKEYGMDESYLCRLLDRFPYLKDYYSFKNGFDNRLVTKLNENYRSLKEVISLPNKMFYDGTLIAKVDESITWTSKFINATCEIFESQSNTGGVFVYGIKGSNLRAEDSPSWYNPQEAAMLALTVCKLYKRNITVDEIGVITPYLAQVKYCRYLFDSMGLPQPKIGTTEEFQGQERPIILISTVRSTEDFLNEDLKHSLGFVKSSKRLNVALTRARISTIIFCNPHLLSTDILWKKVIDSAISKQNYMGCDMPIQYDETSIE